MKLRHGAHKALTASLTLAALLAAAPVPSAGAEPARNTQAAKSAAARLHALFDEDWQWTLRTFPELATRVGDHRYDDRLTDESPAALDAQDRHAREVLARLKAIPRESLSAEDRVSYDVFRHRAESAVEGQRFPQLRWMALTAMEGLHIELPQTVQDMPLRTERDVRNLLARLRLYPSRVDQTLVLLRRGLDSGWVTFRASMERVVPQIEGQLADDPRKSPLFEPFTRLPADLPAARRAELAAAAEQVLREHTLPALRRLRQFVVDDYLPKAPANGALSAYPGGRELYAYLVRQQTTTELSAQAIHDLGLKEVARLRGEMEALMHRTGFAGSFEQFVQFLNTDPRFFHTDAAALLAGYRDIAKRVDPELPKLFAELPRQPYGIRPMPAYQGEGQAEYYSGGAADGSRAGWFNANVLALANRPIWEMEALFLHEAVPGHHLQSARAQEQARLPDFRRNDWYVAYGEGWALYAESLGEALGLYTDPYSKYGQLRMEIWRAARLVVDTGIHALDWSRAQAIDWMVERTGISRADVEPEIDRYYVMPAQALGYKIGQLKLLALRDQARQALGEAFDIRRFHMAVLDQGAVPLPVLERQVGEWIARERAASVARDHAAPGRQRQAR
jgi:uncharacterized protein (DUF885 family)